MKMEAENFALDQENRRLKNDINELLNEEKPSKGGSSKVEFNLTKRFDRLKEEIDTKISKSKRKPKFG